MPEILTKDVWTCPNCDDWINRKHLMCPICRYMQKPPEPKPPKPKFFNPIGNPLEEAEVKSPDSPAKTPGSEAKSLDAPAAKAVKMTAEEEWCLGAAAAATAAQAEKCPGPQGEPTSSQSQRLNPQAHPFAFPKGLQTKPEYPQLNDYVQRPLNPKAKEFTVTRADTSTHHKSQSLDSRDLTVGPAFARGSDCY